MNKKIIYLLTWYIFWNIIASLYWSKSGDKIKTEMQNAKKEGEYKDIKVLFQYLLHLHEKVLSDIASEDNKKQAKEFLDSTGKKVQDFVEPYTPEIKKIIQEYKNIWEKEANEITLKMQGFMKSAFESWKNYISNLSKDVLSPFESPTPVWEHLKKEPLKRTASKKSSPQKRATKTSPKK